MNEYEVGSRIMIRMIALFVVGPSFVSVLYTPIVGGTVLPAIATIAFSLLTIGFLYRWPRFAVPTIVLGDVLLLVALTPLLGGFAGPIPAAWPAPILMAAFARDRRLVWGVLAVAIAHLVFSYALDVNGFASWHYEQPHDRLFSLGALACMIAFVSSGVYQHQRTLVAQAREHEATAISALAERDLELMRREAIEVELQHTAQVAKAASQAKSDFLASMSHELRTPLNAIIGYAEILIEELDEPEQADDCQRIRSSGRHLLTLINDVLDLSKIEAGRMELHRTDVNVTDLLRDLRETVAPMVEAKNNVLIIEAEAPGSIHTDGVRVHQVLLNLLSNAAKFTTAGTVTLQVHRKQQNGRELLVFEVNDTGIGIDDAAMSRLFRPFVQADGSTSRRFGGTGLGLVLARHFAEMLEGEVLAESRPGEGSRFTLLLPCSTAASELDALVVPRLEEARHTERPVVVCVDDEPGALLLLDRLLLLEGFHPVLCTDSRTAVDLVRELRPALVTLDLHMPGFGGAEVLHALRSDPEVGTTPVLFCSIDDDVLSLENVNTRTVSKPVERAALVDALAGFVVGR